MVYSVPHRSSPVDVFGFHTPMSGAVSRMEWNHSWKKTALDLLALVAIYVLALFGVVVFGWGNVPETDTEPTGWPTIFRGSDEGCDPDYKGNQAC